MEPTFREVDAASESGELTAFLCRHEWPFHGVPRLTPEQVREMSFSPPSTRTFWIDVEGEHAGLLRVQDLEDIGHGSPVFDIRVAPAFRGSGLGRLAVSWMTSMVFREYAGAHRIEATTRIDNAAMRKVLERCGFQLEGRLRESWPTDTGTWVDTAVYGLLRSEAGG